MSAKKLEKLTTSEEIVMKSAWYCPKTPTRAEILDRITDTGERDWKPQTVSTFLNRLVGKKYLKMHRKGKVYTYQRLISRADYQRHLYMNLVHFWYNDDVTSFLLDMVKNGDLPKEEIYKHLDTNED